MTGLSQMEVLPAASARYAKIRLLVSESDCTVHLVTGLEKRSSKCDGEPVSPDII